jgi:hypothetical protein
MKKSSKAQVNSSWGRAPRATTASPKMARAKAPVKSGFQPVARAGNSTSARTMDYGLKNQLAGIRGGRKKMY